MAERVSVAGSQVIGELSPGLIGEHTVIVTENNTALALGSGSVPVFGTPALAAAVEAAAIAALDDVLADGQTSVGVSLEIQHQAATPIGMTIRAEARLMAVQGRRLTFRVSACDAVEQIGSGTHQRVVVDTERFLVRTTNKGV